MNYLALFLPLLFFNSESVSMDNEDCLMEGNTEANTVIVAVKGTGMDARFEPAVVHVQPGDVIQFEVMEGLHTVTAYHPDNRRPQRIPDEAESFDSGPLQAGQTWQLEIKHKGIYNYFCLPHESMGHVGRIVSGNDLVDPGYDYELLPEAVKLKYQYDQH